MVTLCVGALLTAAPAAAQTASARCRRIQATAESQAFLFFSPTIWAEGLHIPRVGDESAASVFTGSGWQARTALSFSAVDAARGALLLDAASAECREQDALARARRILELGDEIGELPARRAEREAIVSSRARVESLLARAEARRRDGLATETQLADLRAEASRLERRVAQLDAAIERLVAEDHDTLDVATLRRELDEYEHATMERERTLSTARRLMPWTVQVRAGVVPAPQLDWFGQLTVGLNLGMLAQQVAENAVLDARAAELGERADELRAHVERLERRLAASARALQVDVEHVDRRIALIERQHALLGGLETAEVDHVRAMLELELVALGAERAHLERLAEVRAQVPHAGGSDVEHE